MITIQHYKDAINVQDACNLSGVVFDFSQVMEDICEEAHIQGHGTEWKNQHVLSILWAYKIAELTGQDIADPGIFAIAYAQALKLSQGVEV